MNPIKRIKNLFKKKLVDTSTSGKQIEDISKRELIKKSALGLGIGAGAALLSKIPSASAVQNINYNDGTNAMNVNSDGTTDSPNQSASLTTLSSTQSGITTSTITKLTLATEIYDVQNEFDSSTNYRFTATVAGKYAVFAELAISNLGTDKQMVPRLRVNGGNKNNFYLYSPSGGDVASFLSTVVDLSASDYIELFHEHYHGSDRTGNSKLAIHKIS